MLPEFFFLMLPVRKKQNESFLVQTMESD